MSDDTDALVRQLLERSLSADRAPEAAPGPDDLYFASAADAEQSVSRTSAGARYLRAVAEHVADDANGVCGGASDFFNLAVEFERHSDPRSALIVARRGLRLHPASCSLLSAALRAATECGDHDACEGLVAQARDIDEGLWSARLYLRVVQYYQDRVGELPDACECALEAARAYERRYPFEDKAYDEHACTLIAMGRVDEASALLHKVIFGTVGPDDNDQRSIAAPCCCVTYIDKILASRSDRAAYEEIIRVARKGVQFTAETQPSVNIGALLYRDAEAQDALICSYGSGHDGFANEGRVREALRTYRCAYQLCGDPDYRGTIRTRYLILSTQSGVTDEPLES